MRTLRRASESLWTIAIVAGFTIGTLSLVDSQLQPAAAEAAVSGCSNTTCLTSSTCAYEEGSYCCLSETECSDNNCITDPLGCR